MLLKRQKMNPEQPESKPIKRHLPLIIVLALLFVLWVIPGPKMVLFDEVLKERVHNFNLETRWTDTVFAPFLDTPDYFISFMKIGQQTLSWLLWIWACVITAGIIRKRKPRAILSGVVKSFLLLLLIVLYIVFFPYGGNKIASSNEETVFLNFQSHTYYSWDGVASLSRSEAYHRRNGYDGYAITEHHLKLSDAIGASYMKEKYPHMPIIEGWEFRAKKKVHFCLFGVENTEEFDKDYAKARAALKEAGGSAFPVEWWEKVKLNDIFSQGLESVELFNMGHPYIPKSERRSAIRLNREEGLTLLGNTDWHGMVYKANVWTSTQIPGWNTMSYSQKQAAMHEVIKGRYGTRVIRYGRVFDPKGIWRYIFEPFVGLTLYFAGISFSSLLSWYFWILAGFCGVRYLKKKNLGILIWVITSAGILWVSIFLGKQYLAVSKYNYTCGEFSIIFFIFSLIGWVIVWREWKGRKPQEPTQDRITGLQD